MSSIPLPALHINPPAPPPNMLEQASQLMQLRNMAQMAPLQQQAMQQNVQAGQLDLQQKQIALKDQQAMNAAMQQWGQPKSAQAPAADGAPAQTQPTAQMPDYDELLRLARQNGASFNAISGLQKQILDMKDKASSIVKNDAQAGSANATAMKAKNGMIVDAMNGVMNLPDDQVAPALMQTAQQLAQQGLLDPQHIQMAQQLAQSGDPATIRQHLDVYAKSLGGFSKMIEDAQKRLQLQQTQGKTDPNSPLYSPSPAAVAMGTAPGAAQIQAGEVKQAARKAGAEESARMPGEMALAQQRQALSQGDPNAAGQLLVNGDATLSELKSRGATPDFIARALFAARKLSGGQYNAQAADAAFDVAKSPANVAFFGSAKSLTDPGGTLDQLADAGKKIPGGQIPAFNSIADWEKAATGSGPIAEYAARVLGVADDYSKVMSGGQGSDTSRQQALNLISAKLSPEQRAAALQGIRGSVTSQVVSRIGNNPVLKRMYGDVAQPAASGGTLSAPPQSIVDSAQEGQYIHGPNGEIFKKVNGKAVKQ